MSRYRSSTRATRGDRQQGHGSLRWSHAHNHEGQWDIPIAEVNTEQSVNDARADDEEAIRTLRVVW